MELFHLRYFVAVAEELHVTRAAARLHMAASPLSRRIRDLERELGADLFVRAHHRITLTLAGELLLPRARDVLRRVDALAGVVAPRATVGIAPDVTPAIRDAFLAAVAAHRPGLDVRLRPGHTAALLRAVTDGELDLAFVHGPAHGLAARRVGEQPAGVAVAAGLGLPDPVRLAALAPLPYVSIHRDAAPAVYGPTLALLARHGIPHVELDGQQIADLVPPVVTGRGFTLVGLEAGATHKAFLGEPVAVLRVADADLRLTTDAVWRADRAASPPVTDLLHALPKTETRQGTDGGYRQVTATRTADSPPV